MSFPKITLFIVLLVSLATGCVEEQTGTTARSLPTFEQADLDKNGELSLQEAVFVPDLRITVVDQDNDGTITPQEYDTWVRGDKGTIAESSRAASEPKR